MIVRTFDQTLQVITQPDHAQLSRRVMECCAMLAGHPRRASVLHAIGEHDNGWREDDAAPTVSASGEIYDFVTAPASVRQAVWPRGVGRLNNDPWAAALVAQHAITVYDRFRNDAAWDRFFANMESLRDAMVRASRMPIDDLIDDYKYVRLGDLISLVFCTGWIDEHSFGGWTVRPAGARVLVSPDLFGAAAIPLEIVAKEIPRRAFRSDTELRGALSDAAMVSLRGEAAGSSYGR